MCSLCMFSVLVGGPACVGKTGGSVLAFLLGRSLLGPTFLTHMMERMSQGSLMSKATRAMMQHPMKATFLFR